MLLLLIRHAAAAERDSTLWPDDSQRPLTDKGRKLATASRERHLIVRDFLVAIGVDADTADADAEGIEHHVSRATLEAFRRHLAKQRRARE